MDEEINKCCMCGMIAQWRILNNEKEVEYLCNYHHIINEQIIRDRQRGLI